MPDLLADAASWLADQHAAHVSKTVTYRRGSESVTLAATIGDTTYEQTDDEGIVTEIRTRDYLIRAADLLLFGAPELPQKGDRIEEIDGPLTFLYEVLPDAVGETWRWSDPHRVTLRVHTKEVRRTDE